MGRPSSAVERLIRVLTQELKAGAMKRATNRLRKTHVLYQGTTLVVQ